MSDSGNNFKPLPPSPAFVGASWLVVGVGIITYSAWLWNSPIIMDVKYFYWVSLMLALFAAVSISKTVRDKEEGIPTTGMYFGLA